MNSIPQAPPTNRCLDCVTLSLIHSHMVQVLALIEYICVSFMAVPWPLGIHPLLPIYSPECTGDSGKISKDQYFIILDAHNYPQLTMQNIIATEFNILSCLLSKERGACWDRRVQTSGLCKLAMNNSGWTKIRFNTTWVAGGAKITIHHFKANTYRFQIWNITLHNAQLKSKNSLQRWVP